MIARNYDSAIFVATSGVLGGHPVRSPIASPHADQWKKSGGLQLIHKIRDAHALEQKALINLREAAIARLDAMQRPQQSHHFLRVA